MRPSPAPIPRPLRHRRAALLAVAALLVTSCTFSISSEEDPSDPSDPSDPAERPSVTLDEFPERGEQVTRPTHGLEDDETDDGDEVTDRDDDAVALVLVDGWSVATAGTTEIAVSYDTDDDRYRGRLQPVTVEQFATIAAVNPELVRTAAARLLDGDSTLECDTDGCTSDSRQLPLSALVTPSTDVDGYGPVYDTYDVDHGLYWAAVRVPDGTSMVDVAIGESDPAVLTLTHDGPEPDDDEYVTPDPDTVFTGLGRNEFLVGAAYGRSFILEPEWHYGAEYDRFARIALPLHTDPRGDALPLINGLSSTVPAAEGLTASQLTWLSSVPTGCGLATVCAPGPVSVNVDIDTEEDLRLCTEDDDALVAGRFAIATLTYDMPGPTHQRGLWFDQSTDDFATGSGRASGVAPLIEGTHTAKLAVGTLYDHGGQLLDHVAWVAHEDHDAFEQVNLDEVIDATLEAYPECAEPDMSPEPDLE